VNVQTPRYVLDLKVHEGFPRDDWNDIIQSESQLQAKKGYKLFISGTDYSFRLWKFLILLEINAS